TFATRARRLRRVAGRPSSRVAVPVDDRRSPALMSRFIRFLVLVAFCAMSTKWKHDAWPARAVSRGARKSAAACAAHPGHPLVPLIAQHGQADRAAPQQDAVEGAQIEARAEALLGG